VLVVMIVMMSDMVAMMNTTVNKHSADDDVCAIVTRWTSMVTRMMRMHVPIHDAALMATRRMTHAFLVT
jgi:hypothetical protein